MIRSALARVHAFFGRTITLGTLWCVVMISFLTGLSLILAGWRERDQLEALVAQTYYLCLIAALFTAAELVGLVFAWAWCKLRGGAR